MHLDKPFEFDFDRKELQQILKTQKGVRVTISTHERIDFDADDVWHPEPSDLETMYNEFGDEYKADFLKRIKEAKLLELQEATSAPNIAEEIELELLLSFRGKYSLDELKRRLEATDFLTDLNTQTGGCWNCGESGTVAEYVNG